MLKKLVRKDVSQRFNILSDSEFNEAYQEAMINQVLSFIGSVISNTFYGLIILVVVAFYISSGSSKYIPNILPELESGIHEYKIISIEENGAVQNYIFDEKGDVE